MAMSMGRRRYKVGQFPEYDFTFDRLAQSSTILNPGRAQNDIHSFGFLERMKTRHGLERLLEEWEGDENGDYILDRKPVPSRLKEAGKVIEGINEAFVTLNQRRVNKGSFPLKEMPNEMLQQLHKAEAAQDIVKDEIKKLQEMLNRVSERVEQETKKCLPRGPIGSGQLRGGVLVLIDGQEVLPDKQDVLRIHDDRSPYHGMRAADYRETVVPMWRAARDKWQSIKREEEQSAAREGRKVEITEPYPTFPAWPEGIEKFDWQTG